MLSYLNDEQQEETRDDPTNEFFLILHFHLQFFLLFSSVRINKIIASLNPPFLFVFVETKKKNEKVVLVIVVSSF